MPESQGICGMEVTEAQRLKELGEGDRRLMRLVDDLSLDRKALER